MPRATALGDTRALRVWLRLSGRRMEDVLQANPDADTAAEDPER
jgi:hypothetical protein